MEPSNTPEKTLLFISLFHGRKSKFEALDEWGSTGPVIGPVGIGFTYGSIKLFDPSYSDFEFLPVEEDMVRFDGVYYGDFEVLTTSHPAVTDNTRTKISYSQFCEVVKSDKCNVVAEAQTVHEKMIFTGDLVVLEDTLLKPESEFFPLGELALETDQVSKQVRVKCGWLAFDNVRPLMHVSFFRKRYEEQLAFKKKAIEKQYYSENRRREVLSSIDVITERFRQILEHIDAT